MGAILAIDIGGTQMRVALYPPQDIQPVRHQRTATRSGSGTVFDRLTALIDSVWDDGVEVISVASAGPLDPESGIILSSPNIPGWINFPLGERLAGRYRVPIHIGNDANLAALGEWKYGAGRGHNDLLYITISTGIGGGVISNGCLLLGHHGLAAELGHITVLPDGPLCPCGQRGHLEAVASGPAISAYVLERLAGGATSSLSAHPGLDAQQVAEAARAGDRLAVEAYARAGEALGRALADFLHIFNPSIVIFGGGVSRSGGLFFDPLKTSLAKHVMEPGYTRELVLTTAQLGDEAGLLGALAHAHLKRGANQA